MYAAKPSLTNYIFNIYFLLFCLICSAAFRGYDNLVPRVLSYPPYGASLSLRRASRREPWERWFKIEQAHIDQRFDNKREWKCQFRKSIIEDFSGNELTLRLEKLTQSVILENVLFSFITTMNCSKSYSAVKWLVCPHFWNILQQFWLKLLLHTFKYVLQCIFTGFYCSADTRNFSHKYLQHFLHDPIFFQQ